MPGAPFPSPSSFDLIEAWRTLGSDYASWGRRGPTDAPAAFFEGYAERGGRRKNREVTRFVAKWLQIRYNALRRGRVVDDGVTPSFIQRIDTAVCPVTLIELTHGKHQDSDWSIDRVNNDGAYAPQNLIVISTKANRAKGSKTFEEVARLADGEEAAEGLEAKEWLRLEMLMQGACTVGTALAQLPLPLVTKIPSQCARTSWLDIQHMFHLAASRRADRKALNKWKRHFCPNNTCWERFNILLDAIGAMRKRVSYEYDVWAEPKIQQLMVEWMNQLSPLSKLNVQIAARAFGGGQSLKQSEIDAWSLQSRGYMP